MKCGLTTFVIGILCVQCYAQAQTTAPPHPKFSTFKGTVYRMPVVEIKYPNGKSFKGLQEKYGDNVYDYPVLQEIELPELKIPETYIDEGKFPGGVEKNTQYAMVLKAGMQITHKACYEFSLNSDDGSILWVDGQEIINNDGGHEMTFKNDSLVYEPGEYEVKVWYFQGLADRFGLELDARIVGKAEVCPHVEGVVTEKKLNLDSKVFFESGSAKLRPAGIEEISRVATLITEHKFKTIKIIGHTDNVGSEMDNQELSLSRAQVISVALKSMMDEDYIFITEGKGESSPVASNDTEEGRQQNRRVELLLQD